MPEAESSASPPDSPRSRRRGGRSRRPGGATDTGRPGDAPGDGPRTASAGRGPHGGSGQGAADAPRARGGEGPAGGGRERSGPSGSARSSGASGSSGGRGGRGGGGRSGGPPGRGGPRGRRGHDDREATRPRDAYDVEGDDEDDDGLDESAAIPVSECAFSEYDLREDLVRAIAACGYHTPSPIQARTLPQALEGRDIVGQAKTGTGKTAAFLIPALQMLTDRPGPRICVVVPTRELAMQVAREARRLVRYMDDAKVVAIYGGDPMPGQVKALKAGARILAATPGRLLDHMGRGTIRLDDLDVMVLDEADRMFDLGFRDDIAKILRGAPGRRQTMLFSATLSDEVLGLAEKYMKDPARVFLAPDKLTVEKVRQSCLPVDKPRKTLLLLKVLEIEQPERSIIFTRTKHGADRLADTLKRKGLPAMEIHSGLRQKRRERILQGFRDGEFKYLIATDVAARGLDIDDVSHVINFDIPENAEDYVHRIGRTARMGREGRGVTFVAPEDGEFLTAIEKLINQEIPVERYEDFVHNVGDPDAPPKPTGPPKGPSYTRTIHGYVRRRPRR